MVAILSNRRILGQVNVALRINAGRLIIRL